MLKLNIGAGSTVIPGFTPIDRKLGSEAYPLNYPDNSVDEIRASHILEHFSFADAQAALKDWTRVLKPGGKIRLAVPDLDAAAKADPDEWPFIVMGGQTDEDNIHRSAWNETRLRAHMEHFGLENVRRWESPNTDTAAHPCSLNLEGFKKTTEKKADGVTVKVGAYLTLPRYEAVAARTIIQEALKPHRLDLTTTQGVFWGQCMQRMVEAAVAEGRKYILTVDYDSVFDEHDIVRLWQIMETNPEVDVLCPLQIQRDKENSLVCIQGPDGKFARGISEEQLHCEAIDIYTGHFGLTLIRVASLEGVQRPLFWGQPDAEGGWGSGRIDDDIQFWNQMRKAGRRICLCPRVRIGHLQLVVTWPDEQYAAIHQYHPQYTDEGRPPCTLTF